MKEGENFILGSIKKHLFQLTFLTEAKIFIPSRLNKKNEHLPLKIIFESLYLVNLMVSTFNITNRKY